MSAGKVLCKACLMLASNLLNDNRSIGYFHALVGALHRRRQPRGCDHKLDTRTGREHHVALSIDRLAPRAVQLIELPDDREPFDLAVLHARSELQAGAAHCIHRPDQHRRLPAAFVSGG